MERSSKSQSESDRAKKKVMKQMGMPDLNRNDAVNRLYLQQEEDMPQAVTFRNGLEFLKQNHQEDRWFLQIETFDPHEPFFVSERFRQMYPDPDYTGKEFDWPPYAKVTETPEEVEHCRRRYQALVSMCDYYLGEVLDAMDEYNLWEDTLLIVNTDHGFLLGEHGWWEKSVMPYYNEIAHIPMFIWDPRSKAAGERRDSLVQNIDVAPTILAYCGMEPAKDMLGKSLDETVKDDTPVRKYALFGSHGNHINITDGSYVYMRCPETGARVYEYTLMPTHMRGRFSVEELQKAVLAGPFSFTKGCRVLKIPAGSNPLSDPSRYGNRLYCVKKDPGQVNLLEDAGKEAELTEEIRRLMLVNDAPEELYSVYGVEMNKEYTVDDRNRQKEKKEELEVDGFEGFKADKAAYRQLQALAMALPKEQADGLRQAMRRQLEAAGQKQITGRFVIQFAKTLPLPEEFNKQALVLLQGMMEESSDITV